MIIVITFLFVSISYILYYIIGQTLWKMKASKMTANIPGPKPLPIIGNALYFASMKTTEDMLKILKSLYEDYVKLPDRIAKFWMGSKLIIALSNPKYIETVLSSKEALKEDSFYDYLGLVTNGMFVLNGPKWHELRKPFNRVLTKTKIESSITDMHEKALKLNKLWKNKAKNRESLNLRHDTMNFFGDSISESVLGYELNELDNNELNLAETIEKCLELVFSMLLQVPYNLSFTIAQFSNAARKVKNYSQLLLNLSIKMLKSHSEKRKKLEDEHKEQPKTYTDTILEVGKRYQLNEELTAKMLLDVFIAGFDTSSISAASALLMLAMFPEHQQAVYEEQVKILGDDPNVIPTWDQLNSMTYLDRVIKEVIRLISPNGVLRRLSEDIDLGEYKLPKGSTAYITFYFLHRDPQFWSHPEEFYPDHFLDEAVANRPKGTFLPFGFGPRGCPGKLLGMISNKVLLSTVLRMYKFETDLKFNEIKYKCAFLMEVSQGYHCRIKLRNKLC